VTHWYELTCWLAAAACAVSAVVGAIAYRSGSAQSRAWIAIRAAQAAIIVPTILAALHFAGLGASGKGLQFGYSLMAAAVSFAAEQLRLASAATVLASEGIEGSAEVAALPEDRQNALALRIALRELGVETVALAVCVALLLRGAGAY
jgi:hypothetical protein